MPFSCIISLPFLLPYFSLFLGHIQWCSEVNPGSWLSNPSRKCSDVGYRSQISSSLAVVYLASTLPPLPNPHQVAQSLPIRAQTFFFIFHHFCWRSKIPKHPFRPNVHRSGKTAQRAGAHTLHVLGLEFDLWHCMQAPSPLLTPSERPWKPQNHWKWMRPHCQAGELKQGWSSWVSWGVGPRLWNRAWKVFFKVIK